jgi:hypothetical protein
VAVAALPGCRSRAKEDIEGNGEREEGIEVSAWSSTVSTCVRRGGLAEHGRHAVARP